MTTDEATTTAAYLGLSPAHFNRQPLAARIVVIKMMQEIAPAYARQLAAGAMQ